MVEALPEPENGLVVRFNYRWAGDLTPRKDRPVCIALVRLVRDPRHDLLDGPPPLLKEVSYLPISSQPPRGGQVAVRIPPRVMQHLGFTQPESWIYLSECNVQFWPNDLERLPDGQRWSYGFIPPKLFAQVRELFIRQIEKRSVTIENVHFLPPRTDRRP